ncbi:MAG: CvpA family protein [Planctomycetales bacterium]
MEALFGLILLLILGAVTWCVASEGAWGAALMLVTVIFAGLLTMSFFEPLAATLEDKGPGAFRPYADITAFMGLFALFTFLLRLGTDYLAPNDVQVDARVYHALRWLFALATGYTTVAILLTALHTAPLPRKFIGFQPESRNLFEFAAPDRQWLGFVQHVSEKILMTGRIFDGPVFVVKDGEQDFEQKVWPSFPIRYATRRRELEAGGGGARKVGAPSGGSGSAPAAPSGPGATPAF